MAISYDNLWKLLMDKKKKRTDLITGAGISSSVSAKMGRDEQAALENADKICKYFDCTPESVFMILDS